MKTKSNHPNQSYPLVLQYSKSCTTCGVPYLVIHEGQIKASEDDHIWFNCPCNSTHLILNGKDKTGVNGAVFRTVDDYSHDQRKRGLV